MEIFKLVLTIVLGVAVAVLIPLYPIMKKRAQSTPTTVDDTILEMAIKAVKWADEMFNKSTGEVKKTRASVKLLEELAGAGVKSVANDTLNQALETAVTKVRAEEAIKSEEPKEAKTEGK